MSMTGLTKKRRDYFRDETYQIREKLSVKCKCGHNITINNAKGYKVCMWCKRLVFANEEIERNYRQDEFKKRMRRKLNE